MSKKANETTTEKEKIHNGHRERIKDRFIEAGTLDEFNEHQVLELLLFYCVPMKDTNGIAHKLLNYYGSLYNLFNAPVEDLMENGKLTKNMAVYISMMPHVYRRYMQSKMNPENTIFSSSALVGEYFMSFLQGKNHEELYMMCLNEKKQLIRTVCVSRGNGVSTALYVDKIVENAVFSRCCYVALGHNHPADTPMPSENDIRCTEMINETMVAIGVKLIDHIIVCGEGYTSMAAKNKIIKEY